MNDREKCSRCGVREGWFEVEGTDGLVCVQCVRTVLREDDSERLRRWLNDIQRLERSG